MFRRQSILSPGPSSSTDITTPVERIPTWELESRFLGSFDTYENSLLEALFVLIGPVAQSLDLHSRVQFLQDMGVHSEADRSTWAGCLKVRQGVLLGADSRRPARVDVENAAEAMKLLEDSIRAWIAEQTELP